MPRWKSVIKTKEEKNADGSVKTQGVVAWIPENDAARAHRLVEKAVQLGAYTPKDANERENVDKKLRDGMRDDLRRKGLIPKQP